MERHRPIDRIEAFAKKLIELHLLRSVSAFERVCGLSNKYISNMARSDRGSYGVDILDRIYDTFPILNLEWAVTGKGNMLKREPTPEQLWAISQRIIDRLTTLKRKEDLLTKTEI